MAARVRVPYVHPTRHSARHHTIPKEPAVTTVETLLVLAVLCDPTPHPGYGWRVDAELAAHDRAMETLATTDSPREWQEANAARIAAETRLARLLDVQPQPAPVFDYDDGFARFFA